MSLSIYTNTETFVQWFRSAAPYIYAFRGRTFVVAFGGEVVSDGKFVELVHDLNLLNSLGVRLVLVHGARPQIEARLRESDVSAHYVNGLRVTDEAALVCVKEAVGKVRVEIESLLSMGLANSPMAGSSIRVASGNFVIAMPMGVRDGVDLKHTGEVRKVDAEGIRRRLDQGEIVLLSPLGYSPTGEIFNLSLENVATATAVALGAEKMMFLMDTAGVVDEAGHLLKELTAQQAEKLLLKSKGLPEDVGLYLPCAIRACRKGVARAHLISRHADGAVLLEMFTHEGIGTMVSKDPVENLRQATIDDVGGVLQVIEPLEAEGVLVRRSRELLEMEIERFTVLEHDGMIIGCAALYPFAEENAAELACLAIHKDYLGSGRGGRLLQGVQDEAKNKGINKLFVLTTRTAHWFIEHGFKESDVDQLPKQKRDLYNFQRRSKVFVKPI